jgi:hypothetical protein
MDYKCTVTYPNGDKLDWWLATSSDHITDWNHAGP